MRFLVVVLVGVFAGCVVPTPPQVELVHRCDDPAAPPVPMVKCDDPSVPPGVCDPNCTPEAVGLIPLPGDDPFPWCYGANVGDVAVVNGVRAICTNCEGLERYSRAAP